MRHRALSTIGVVALVVLTGERAAFASGDAHGGGYVEGGTPTAVAGTVTSQAGFEAGSDSDRSTGSGSSSEWSCTFTPIILDPGERVYEADGGDSTPTEPGTLFGRECVGPNGARTYDTVFTPDQQPIDPARLAEEALRQLPLELPAARTSPDAAGAQLVGVPTWLWVEGGWDPRSASASVPGVVVTVTAVPVSVRWSMGDGGEVVCAGPGVAYDRGRSDGSQSTDCSYTYGRSSAGEAGERFGASATVTWRVSWSAAGVAGGGNLGSVQRTSEFGLRVAEAQALQAS